MAHPDSETQIGAHSVFSMVLMPSMFSPWLDHKTKIAQKAQNDSFSTQHETFSGAENLNGKLEEGKAIASVNGKKYVIHPYRGYSFTPKLTDGEDVSNFLLIIVNCMYLTVPIHHNLILMILVEFS